MLFHWLFFGLFWSLPHAEAVSYFWSSLLLFSEAFSASLHPFEEETPGLQAEQKEWEIMDVWNDMMMMSSFLFLSFLSVVNICFSLGCILITSMNSFSGIMCHSPELLLSREAVNPSFYIWKQDWFSPTFRFVYIKFHLSFYCPLNLAGSFCKSA